MKASTYLKNNKLPCGKAYGIYVGMDAKAQATLALAAIKIRPAGPTQLKICSASIFLIEGKEVAYFDEGFVIILRKFPGMNYPCGNMYAQLTGDLK